MKEKKSAETHPEPTLSKVVRDREPSGVRFRPNRVTKPFERRKRRAAERSS